ncbi:MAG TPA: L-histidine N(alpha)-methyltransferase [Trebonia sp.]
MTVVNLLPPGFLDDALRAEVRTGLTMTPKALPSKWRYDVHGTALFEKLRQLPEYYPARTESAIVRAAVGQVAELSVARTLVELGLGSPEKTRMVLDAFRSRVNPAAYVGVDISPHVVGRAERALVGEYPDLAVRAIVADFEEHLGLPGYPGAAPRLVLVLGSTLGNMLPPRRAAFLARVRSRLAPGDSLLLGAGLVKEPRTLLAGYDDGAGAAAAFNRNILAVLNARLGADFDPDAFDHVAAWVPGTEWIELRLRSVTDQQVRIPGAGLTVSFAAGEEVCADISARFRRAGLAAELRAAGFAERCWWTDQEEMFAISLSVPV